MSKGKSERWNAQGKILVTVYYLPNRFELKRMIWQPGTQATTKPRPLTTFILFKLPCYVHLCLDSEVTDVTSHLLDARERWARDLVAAESGVN